MDIRIGAHPSNLTLTALMHAPHLQSGLTAAGLIPRFTWFPNGEAAQVGMERLEIDVIGTGSTRAIVAQANGLPIAYIAASRPRATTAAILVASASAITQATGLRGTRIGLIDGSFHTYFLLSVLDQAAVPYRDVTIVDLSPKAASQALRAGEIDAWIAADPYLSAAIKEGSARVLVGCEAVIPNRSLFWLRRDVLSAAQIATIVRELDAADLWIGANPAAAGEIFARAIGGGLTAQQWADGLASRVWGLVAADQEVIHEQQHEADLLAKYDLLPRRINVMVE
jgi:ABC-type nitrate/sulfonate/bicarbonate transport system substrate-binding protein